MRSETDAFYFLHRRIPTKPIYFIGIITYYFILSIGI